MGRFKWEIPWPNFWIKEISKLPTKPVAIVGYHRLVTVDGTMYYWYLNGTGKIFYIRIAQAFGPIQKLNYTSRFVAWEQSLKI